MLIFLSKHCYCKPMCFDKNSYARISKKVTQQSTAVAFSQLQNYYAYWSVLLSFGLWSVSLRFTCQLTQPLSYIHVIVLLWVLLKSCLWKFDITVFITHFQSHFRYPESFWVKDCCSISKKGHTSSPRYSPVPLHCMLLDNKIRTSKKFTLQSSILCVWWLCSETLKATTLFCCSTTFCSQIHH